MKNNLDLTQALANSLEMLERGEKTVQECLDLYPQHREELSGLLGKFTFLQALPPEHSREEFRKKSHQQLLSMIQGQTPSGASARLHRTQRKFSLARVVIAAALSFFLISGTVAYASNEAVPGEVLYGLDRALEQIQLRMAWSDQQIVALHLRFAAERLDEVEDLVASGDIDHVLEAVENYGVEIASLAKQVAGPDGFDATAHQELVNAALNNHIEVLNNVLEKVPEKAQGAIQNVLEKQKNVPGFLKENGKPDHPGKPAKTAKPDKTGQPDDMDD